MKESPLVNSSTDMATICCLIPCAFKKSVFSCCSKDVVDRERMEVCTL